MPTIEDLPVWTLPPDWATEVISRYEWKTSVVESPTQAEQRRALRVGPRVTLSVAFTEFNQTRSFLDLALASKFSSDWYIPLPYEIGELGATLNAGSTTIPFVRENRQINVPGFALLIGSDFKTYEVISINSAGLTTLTVTATAATWPAGTKLYPLRKGRIMGSPKTARRAGFASQSQIEFLLTEPDYWTGLATLTEYEGFPVWTFLPDDSETMTFSWDRKAYEMDNETGVPLLLDLSGLSRTVQSFRWFIQGRAQHAAFLDLLFFLKGRATPFWVSTYSQDIEITEAVANGDDFITGKAVGYARLDGPVEGRDHIEIRLANGTIYRRGITAVDDSVAGVETFTLDSSMSTGFAVADVLRISYLRLARLDQDAIEIAHITDTAGVARAATAIRSVRENRNGPDWTPVPFDNVEMLGTSCGINGAPNLWITNANGPFDFGYTTVESFTPPAISAGSATQLTKVEFVDGGNNRGMTIARGLIYHTHSASGNIGTFDVETGDTVGGTAIGVGTLRQLAYDGQYIWAGYNAQPQKLLKLTRDLTVVEAITFSSLADPFKAGEQIDGFTVFDGRVILCRRDIGAAATETKFSVYDTRGNLIFANFINASGRHSGITYDGEYIYTSEVDTDTIYRWHTGTGAMVDSFTLANPYTTARAPLCLAFSYQ